MESALEIEHTVAPVANLRPGPIPTREKLDTDEVLVARLLDSSGSDWQAFEKLVARHRGHVVASCRAITGPLEAEDLAQEIFLKVYLSLPCFERRSSFRTWLKRITINQCLDAISRANANKTTGSVTVEVEDLTAPNAQRMVLAPIARRRIRDVLEELPDTLRTPMLLRDRDGLSYQQIADRLDLGLSAVKMRIKRGRATFREIWGPASCS